MQNNALKSHYSPKKNDSNKDKKKKNKRELNFNWLMKDNDLNPMMAAAQSLPRRFPGCVGAAAARSILNGAAEGRTEEMKKKTKKHQQNQMMPKTHKNLMTEKAVAAETERAMITRTVKKPSATNTSFPPPNSRVDDALEEAESSSTSLSH